MKCVHKWGVAWEGFVFEISHMNQLVQGLGKLIDMCSLIRMGSGWGRRFERCHIYST